MIRDFRNQEARLKLQQATSKKIKTLNTKWKKKIIVIKEQQQDYLWKKREEQNLKIQEKVTLAEKILQDNQEKKLLNLREIQEKNKTAVESLHGKIENILNENEIQRLEIQDGILDKIHKYSTNNRVNLEKKHNDFENKLTNSFQNFKSNYGLVLNEIDVKHKQNIEKPVEKYEKWVRIKIKSSI